jgi:hypothetical protein
MARTYVDGGQIEDSSIQDVDLSLGLGTNQISAKTFSTDTTNFNGLLSATENTIQKALDKLDDIGFIGGVNSVIYFDHFIYGDFGNNVGDLRWTRFNIGAGNSVSGAEPNDKLGVLNLVTENTNGRGITLGGPNTSRFYLQNGMDVTFSIRLPNVANTAFRIGLHNETTSVTAPTNGVFFERDTNSSNNIFAFSKANNVATSTNTSVSMSDNTWVKFRFVYTSSNTTTTFYIDGTQVATINTNVPNSSSYYISPAITFFTRTGAVRNLEIDYYRLIIPTAVI